ncbi:MAG: lysine 6-monooxygenase, partial [Streptomyces sp.]|nr:lysine 6-monooxygenase [Streptomyces sp.]
VQNAELHTHGVGAPDLGLAAWRSATILNSLTGKEPYPQPRRTAFTTFGLHPQQHTTPDRTPEALLEQA